MFKVNRRRSGVFIVNFKHISHLVLVFILLTLNMPIGAQTDQQKLTEHYWTKEVMNYTIITSFNIKAKQQWKK